MRNGPLDRPKTRTLLYCNLDPVPDWARLGPTLIRKRDRDRMRIWKTRILTPGIFTRHRRNLTIRALVKRLLGVGLYAWSSGWRDRPRWATEKNNIDKFAQCRLTIFTALRRRFWFQSSPLISIICLIWQLRFLRTDCEAVPRVSWQNLNTKILIFEI